MKSSVVTVLGCLLFTLSAFAQESGNRSCLEPCTSKRDFPYFAHTTTGIDHGYDMTIKKEIVGDAQIKFSLIVEGAEVGMPQSSLISLSRTEDLLMFRMVNYKYDKNWQKPDDFQGSIALKISLVRGEELLTSQVIPFAADTVAEQFFVDEPREIILQSETASAKLTTELIAAGGMKCRWKLISSGTMYCDPLK
ncbi:hypothetical protein AZI87_04360 [Bdellovibrio bacteriovorus]|uniref:Secreted protein n=1 Tax=Bdellovibrio bacteriovorus TaxID=959 RepID=A0A162GM73_BDEBC|nr:hypothetical protein [Bdellovibrio bacteriovorus]KYG68485.1 hypothetical protein AZI87_04360 [Bdellovibrio bacteriovorus]